MKKLISSLFILSLGLMYLSAQTTFALPEEKEVAIYSLPQTELCIEIEIEKTTQAPGTFYLYSERYLATQNVITEEKTNFRLKQISVKTNAIPDPARTYVVPYAKNSIYNTLSVNEKGLLCGLNVTCDEKNTPPEKKQRDKVKMPEHGLDGELLPLTEEYMMAGSTSKMAEGAAKTIYRIRENRLNLITGDVDQLPDGDAMKQMLSQMDKMEKKLTELFVGTTKTEILKQTIHLTPVSEMKDHVLFRVSSARGLVSANDLSGSPYYINVSPETISVEPAIKKSSKQSELFHVLPAKTFISIGDGKNIFFSENIYMPQFGQLIPLPSELIQKKNVKITIDAETGKLLNIEE